MTCGMEPSAWRAEEGGLTGGVGTGTLPGKQVQVVMGVAEVRDVGVGGWGRGAPEPLRCSLCRLLMTCGLFQPWLQCHLLREVALAMP